MKPGFADGRGDMVALKQGFADMTHAALTVLASLAEQAGWGGLSVTAAEGAAIFLHEIANDTPSDLAAEYAWGVSKEEFDAVLAGNAALGREIRRYDAAIKKGLVQSSIRKARDEGDTTASKLQLQALMPERYVPKTKSSLTIEDLREAIKTGTDDELAAIAEVQLEGVGPGGVDPAGQAQP